MMFNLETCIMLIICFILICIILIIRFNSKKTSIINIKELKNSSYSHLVFYSNIEDVYKKDIEKTLNTAYTMKKNEEELLHKYLTFFWGVEAVLIALLIQLLKDVKIPISPMILLASIFISFVGLIFSIYYLSLIKTSNSIVLNFKYHIVFLEHHLSRNLCNIILGNKFTSSIKPPLTKVYSLVEGVTMLWYVALSLILAHLIKTGSISFFNEINYFIIAITFIAIIDIAKMMYFKRNYDVKVLPKVKVSNNIFAIKLQNFPNTKRPKKD